MTNLKEAWEVGQDFRVLQQFFSRTGSVNNFEFRDVLTPDLDKPPFLNRLRDGLIGCALESADKLPLIVGVTTALVALEGLALGVVNPCGISEFMEFGPKLLMGQFAALTARDWYVTRLEQSPR